MKQIIFDILLSPWLFWIAFFALLLVSLPKCIRRLREINDEARRETTQEYAEKAAEDTVVLLKKTFSEQHTMHRADIKNFADRDLRFYDRLRNECASAQFRFLGDVEDATLNETHSSMRTFIRILLSENGDTAVAIFDATPRNFFIRVLAWMLGMRVFKIYEAESELKNGSFVSTSICPPQPLATPDAIIKKHVPAKTAVDKLLHAHTQNVAEACASQKTTVIKHHSLEDVLASQIRQQKILHDHRKAQGFGLSEQEKKNFSAGISKDFAEEYGKQID
jgi:hypothetical protein